MNNTTPPVSLQEKKDKPIINLITALEESDARITFGLQPHQIKVIEDELERFGNREFDAKYVKYVWEKLGKELSWCPFTLALYYFEHLESLTSPPPPTY